MPYIGLWPWSGLCVNLYKKPSKAQLAQQGFGGEGIHQESSPWMVHGVEVIEVIRKILITSITSNHIISMKDMYKDGTRV